VNLKWYARWILRPLIIETGVGIQTSLDKMCSDGESLKEGLGIQTVWIPRPQCNTSDNGYDDQIKKIRCNKENIF